MPEDIDRFQDKLLNIFSHLTSKKLGASVKLQLKSLFPICAFIFSKILFIYLRKRERERERERELIMSQVERQRERDKQTPAEQVTQHRALSQDPKLMTQAKGRCLTN